MVRKVWNGAMKQFAIIGAGLCGATIARNLSDNFPNSVITVFEEKDVVGGNLHEINISGTLIHEHGPHIFHTKSKYVWDFISKFSTWEPYFHQVRAFVRGTSVPVPFNFESIDLLFGESGKTFKSELIDTFGFGSRISVAKLLEAESKSLQFLGNEVFEQIFKGYSEKQWGVPIAEVNQGVLARVPVVISYDPRYFDDKYQYIPTLGYNVLIKNLLSAANIEVKTNTKICCKNIEIEKYDKIFVTGPIDGFFNHEFGKLEYRSLSFEFINGDTLSPCYQTPQTNFPNEFEFTRVVKYGLIASQSQKPIYVAEYPTSRTSDDLPKYYPINNDLNDKLFRHYREHSRKYENLIFAGRLADFKYYNMDQVIGRALKVSSRAIESFKV